MSRPAFELADIFRQHGPAYRRRHRLPRQHLRVMRAIEVCRTAALGGHVEECGQCRQQRISYNSCRNRHCPKCQSLARAQWLEVRKAELLPVEYFHVVFTIPEQAAAIAYYNKKQVYDILFQTASRTLLTIAADRRHLGAQIGFFAILHTWGQNLLYHPHLHCVVPGGGLALDRKTWNACRPGFFLPVRVLSRLFRRLFVEALEKAFQQGRLHLFADLEHLQDPAAFSAHVKTLHDIEWVVYAKPPFGGPQQVLEYLGRYTHRVAISNDRILAANSHQVSFRWKDYRHERKHKVMTLDPEEFLRRFLLHVLPAGFQRIRHFGLLANRNRQPLLTLCRQLLALPADDLLPPIRDCLRLYAFLTGHELHRCPNCKTGVMVRTFTLARVPWADSS